MRVRIKNTAMDRKPIRDEGEVFTGKTTLEVVQAIWGATLFSDQNTLEDYVDMVLRNARMLAGIGRGTNWHAHRRPGMVQALAHDYGRDPG